MTENVCITCQYYESCNRPERFMKCMGYKRELHVGDTIQCGDTDDVVKTMKDLAKEGVETDFLYEKEGVQGLWLEVKKKGESQMYDEQEDVAQLEWCRQWSEEHKKKMTRKMQKKIRRVQHWCNCKLYVKYAWYEFRAMMKG